MIEQNDTHVCWLLESHDCTCTLKSRGRKMQVSHVIQEFKRDHKKGEEGKEKGGGGGGEKKPEEEAARKKEEVVFY